MNKGQKKVILSVFAVAALSVLAIFAYALFGRTDRSTKPSPPAATNAPETTPAPTKNPHENQVQSSLSGQWIDKNTEKKRPFAVVINNIEYAFKHQMGTSKADIMYEALAEGGIPRMMAIYEDIGKIKKIGSIRSARHYFVQFAYEWDAVYCHFGHTKYATAKIKKLKVDNISGLSVIGPVAYWRTNLTAPHNVLTSGKRLLKGAKRLKYTTKRRKGRMAEHFTFYEKDTPLTSGKKAGNISLPFSYYATCKLSYNKKTKTYDKFEYGKKHMDQSNKKQLSFKNVIVQLVKESNIDRNGYQTMALTNDSGDGYYLTDGRQIPIRWKRVESSNTMRYYTKNGELLQLNPGKTYIAVFPKNRRKLIRVK